MQTGRKSENSKVEVELVRLASGTRWRVEVRGCIFQPSPRQNRLRFNGRHISKFENEVHVSERVKKTKSAGAERELVEVAERKARASTMRG